jgi:hydrogenase nickel incorporation protein HypA/HybF
MHELSLAGGIVKIVEDAAARESFRRVSLLRLEAGALSGVEVRSLRFALEAVAPGTCLEGADIVIDEPPGTAWCMVCSASVPLAARGDACPRCGGWQLQPTAGTELRVVEMMVHDD